MWDVTAIYKGVWFDDMAKVGEARGSLAAMSRAAEGRRTAGTQGHAMHKMNRCVYAISFLRLLRCCGHGVAGNSMGAVAMSLLVPRLC